MDIDSLLAQHEAGMDNFSLIPTRSLRRLRKTIRDSPTARSREYTQRMYKRIVEELKDRLGPLWWV